MNVDRVIRAIQRTSHLSNKQMRTQYRELYRLRFQEELVELRWEVRLSLGERISKIRGTACYIHALIPPPPTDNQQLTDDP